MCWGGPECARPKAGLARDRHERMLLRLPKVPVPVAGTGLDALAGALVTRNAIERMLGPTADHVGEGLRAWTAGRVTNAPRWRSHVA